MAAAEPTDLPAEIEVGGVGKAALRAALQAAGVQLNALALVLFDDERFVPLPVPRRLALCATRVDALGHPDGARWATLMAAARQRGLAACPLETAAHLRLVYRHQAEGALGAPATRHRAPAGSITVVSEPPSPHTDDDPCGFYLRRVDGVLWLRGYRSWDGHLWDPADVLLFARADDAAPPGLPLR